MTLAEITTFILEQGKYAVIIGVVFLICKNFFKSKVGSIALALVVGAVAYFFLNDPGKVFDAIGTLIGKVFGGE